jgi:hypothetical protein
MITFKESQNQEKEQPNAAPLPSFIQTITVGLGVSPNHASPLKSIEARGLYRRSGIGFYKPHHALKVRFQYSSSFNCTYFHI